MEKYVVFDWDGTLHETKKLYGEAVRKSYAYLIESGYAKPKLIDDDSLTKYLGMTAKDMWDDFMPNLPEDIRSKAEKIVADSMVELVLDNKAKLYDGVLEMLKTLKDKGYKLMVLSNCKVAYINAFRKMFNLDELFTQYYPAEKYDFIPKSKMLAMAMEEYPGTYVMIGDRFLDIQAGVANNVKTIGCSYGYGSTSELISADYIVASPISIVSKVELAI